MLACLLVAIPRALSIFLAFVSMEFHWYNSFIFVLHLTISMLIVFFCSGSQINRGSMSNNWIITEPHTSTYLRVSESQANAGDITPPNLPHTRPPSSMCLATANPSTNVNNCMWSVPGCLLFQFSGSVETNAMTAPLVITAIFVWSAPYM